MGAVQSKYTVGYTFGRPALYDDPKKLFNKVKKYFKECEERDEKLTATGLALFLGYSSRQSLYDVMKSETDFSYIIKRAMLVIENMYEQRLENSQVAGAIFALSNMGWKNRQAVEVSDPQGNPLPAPTTEVHIGVDYSKLPDDALKAIYQARIQEG